jgi:hypothetical protein
MEQLNNHVYKELHDKLVLRPTRREREQEDMVYNQNQFSSRQNEQQREGWNKKEIRVHVTFETGPMLDFKRELHRLWKKCYIYAGSPMNNVTLKIGTRSNKSISQLLIKNKPPKSMLINADSTNIK